MMKYRVKFLFLVFFMFSSSLLQAYIYNDPYELFNKSLNEKPDRFMSGSFDKIIRFDAVIIEASTLDEEAKNSLDEVIEKIKSLKKNNTQIEITIIGHSSSKEATKNKELEQSKANALSVKQYLVENKIDETFMTLEFRGSKDPAFTENSPSRVMLTAYMTYDKDTDKDGVLASQDKCPDTKENVKVDEHGCKLSTMIILLQGEKEDTSVILKNEKDSLVLNETNQLVSVQSSQLTFSKPQKVSGEELDKLLGSALSAKSEKQIKDTLYFSGLKLTVEAKEKLQTLIETIVTKENAYIKIIGHTDTVGSHEENKELGLKRAQIIADLVKNAGVAYQKLDIDSYSESDLEVQTPDDTFELRNRRVEIFIR